MGPTPDDLLGDAVAELYGLEPGGFTARRNALAAAARTAGAGAAANQIAALRRPTRAAWILNRLARADADLANGFAALSEQLRSAHASLDGAQIRELSRERHQLIDQTAAQAFAAAGVDAPTAALRDDVVATLGAVLADPGVAARFAAGTLVTAEEQSGFGPVGAQLHVVAPLREPSQPAPARPSAREAREQSRRQVALAKAEGEVEGANRAKDDADDAVVEAAEAVRRLTDQLADARRREDDARLAARHAELQVHKAQERLDGLR